MTNTGSSGINIVVSFLCVLRDLKIFNFPLKLFQSVDAINKKKKKLRN